MKITIGIPVYNRLDFLKRLSQSLRHTIGIENCSIRVYDDCSSELTVSDIKKILPFATEINRRDDNLGADLNMRQMYCDFLETGDDILINCDSDMIFRSDWIEFIKKTIPFTDGVLSCYNSYLHPSSAKLIVNSEYFLIKNNIGAAGTAFSRDIVNKIICDVKPSRCFDWDWSNYLTNNGVRLLVTESSYVQHIGLIGYNQSERAATDFGLNFYPDNLDTLILTINHMQKLLYKQQEFYEKFNELENEYYLVEKYKILQWIIEPLAYLKKLILAR